jgi:hypothetical protein
MTNQIEVNSDSNLFFSDPKLKKTEKQKQKSKDSSNFHSVIDGNLQDDHHIELMNFIEFENSENENSQEEIEYFEKILQPKNSNYESLFLEIHESKLDNYFC